MLCQMVENARERNKAGQEVGGLRKGVPVLHRVVGEGLTEKVTLEQRPEGGEGTREVHVGGVGVGVGESRPGRENQSAEAMGREGSGVFMQRKSSGWWQQGSD